MSPGRIFKLFAICIAGRGGQYGKSDGDIALVGARAIISELKIYRGLSGAREFNNSEMAYGTDAQKSAKGRGGIGIASGRLQIIRLMGG